MPRVLNSINQKNIDAFIRDYILIVQMKSRLSRRLREHVKEQIDFAQKIGMIKIEGDTIYKKEIIKYPELRPHK